MKTDIGTILKQWRKQKRYSQLNLAVELDISSKHVCFLETGRSQPSRKMLLKIALFLNIPKSETNRALISAGFAPAYVEMENTHQQLKPVFSAISQMLENHMPYPALVLNQRWDLVNANQAAIDLMGEIGFSGHTNFLEALIADDKYNSNIINWQESMAQVLIRLRNEICMFGSNEFLQNCEKSLSQKVSPEDILSVFDSHNTVLTTQLKLNDNCYSFFSVIASLGAVQDVSVGEFKVELMFPANKNTSNYFKNHS